MEVGQWVNNKKVKDIMEVGQRINNNKVEKIMKIEKKKKKILDWNWKIVVWWKTSRTTRRKWMG